MNTCIQLCGWCLEEISPGDGFGLYETYCADCFGENIYSGNEDEWEDDDV